MRVLIALLVAGFGGSLAAQPAGKPEPPKLVAKPAVSVPDYRTYRVQGFTVLIQDEVFGPEAEKFKRPPLEVLDGELATVVRVVNARSAAALRRLVLWVEWDEGLGGLEAGRPGVVVAVYRTASPQALAARGEHPLKANTVDVLSMKALTAEHQPERDFGRCVLLHEFAHAVHSQLLGRDNAAIKAAHSQAVRRNLYDPKTQYAATSPQEFFAELSCCYLDKLDYYPNTRDDLKKHDPATYKLMADAWAGSAVKGANAAAKAGGPDPTVKLADLRFGPVVGGGRFDPAAAAGKVVLVANWGGPSSNLLDRVARLHADLGPYGLVALAPSPYLQRDDPAAEGTAARVPGVTVIHGGFLPDPDPKVQPTTLRVPETFVFGHDGACVYRGGGYDADKAACAAVGARLLAGLGADPLPAAFKGVSAAFDAGATPLGVLPKVAPLLQAADPETKALARKLADAVLAPLQGRLDNAVTQAKESPRDAFLAAEQLQADAKGTSVGAKAAALAERLKGRPEVAAELRARPLLRQVEALHGRLAAAEGADDPADPRFRLRNAAALGQMARLVAELNKKFAGTTAAERAARLAAEFAVND